MVYSKYTVIFQENELYTYMSVENHSILNDCTCKPVLDDDS